ncbi:MAG: hypothetical protein WCV58_03920 [Patescibacteria group bacterium]
MSVEVSKGDLILEYDQGTSVLTSSLGRPSAEKSEIVRDVAKEVERLELPGGRVIKICGAISAHAAMTVAHALGRRYSAVALYDPATGKHVVTMSYNPEIPIGTTL